MWASRLVLSCAPWKSGPCENACRSCKAGWRFSGGIFDIDGKRTRIAALDEQTTAADFWNVADRAQKVLREQSQIKSTVDSYEGLSRQMEDAGVLIEMADEAKDEATAVEASGTLTAIEDAVGKLEFARMLSGPYDRNGALVSINAGAGGTESQDWAEMLLRMYSRWAERKGYKLEELDRQAGDEAGIKSATIGIEGEWAYGWLRAEAGVHRLVRISPFDANARRHTSFASVFIYPDIDETIKVEIDEKDLRIDVMRSGGAGGQHVNKTESAVRVTHIPTGIAVHSRRRAVAAQEQVDRDAHPSLEAVRGRAEEAGREDGQHPRPEEGDRVGEPDPLLRAGPVPAGHRSPHRAEGGQRRRRAGRRHRSVHDRARCWSWPATRRPPVLPNRPTMTSKNVPEPKQSTSLWIVCEYRNEINGLAMGMVWVTRGEPWLTNAS